MSANRKERRRKFKRRGGIKWKNEELESRNQKHRNKNKCKYKQPRKMLKILHTNLSSASFALKNPSRNKIKNKIKDKEFNK